MASADTTVKPHAGRAPMQGTPATGALPEFATDRGGYIAGWALLGVIWAAIAGATFIQWFASDQFSSAPIPGPDSMGDGTLAALRAVEVISAIVFVGLLWWALIRPYLRDRRVGLDGMLFVGCFVGVVTDGVLNMWTYLFAFNAHSVNLGSWNSFLPLAANDAPRYGEALLWGVPMYVYFVLGVSVAGCAIVRALRRRYPMISNVAALGVVFLAACAFDFIVENAIIRGTEAYAFTKTPGSITVWAGHAYQFPLYEMVCVGLLGAIFTALRLSAQDSPDGLSFVERGLHRLPAGWRRPAQWLAVLGFSATMLLTVYHFPVNTFGSNGDSIAHVPSYLTPSHPAP
jgi:hypothetical protein